MMYIMAIGSPKPATNATPMTERLLVLTTPLVCGSSMMRPLSAVAASEMEFSSRFCSKRR